MKKKLLTIITVMAMVVAMVPSMVFADASYADWTSDNSLPTSGAYKLTCDVTITASNGVTIPNGSSVTLDLNGHTVKFTGGTNCYYYVREKASLTIEDSAGTGLITNDGNSSTSNYPLYVKGTCVMNGGTLENTLSSGSAVFVNDGNNGGNASFTLNDGKVANSRTNSGRAIKVNSNATLTINGGEVESKAANAQGDIPAIEGGASSSKIVMNGGSIDAAGTAIQSSGSPVEITGGSIEADGYALQTRTLTIDPADGKEVNVSAGKAIVRSYSNSNNEILGGTFSSGTNTIMENYPGNEGDVAISGGTFEDMDVKDYIEEGYEQDENGNVSEKETEEPGPGTDPENPGAEDPSDEPAVDPEKPENAVDTGDDSNMVLPIAVAGLALAAMAAVFVTRRRYN